MPELGDSITVIPTRKRSQEITILIAFNRTIRVQSGGADRSPEDTYDRQWLQSGTSDDR